MYKYRNIVYLSFTGDSATQNIFENANKKSLMYGTLMSDHKEFDLQENTQKNIAAYLNTNNKLSHQTLLYIDCHGSLREFTIGDKSRNKVEGISYLTGIFDGKQNPSLTQFQGNGQQHLRLSLVICNAAKWQEGYQESFAARLHKKLREEQNIFCEITARVYLVTLAYQDNQWFKVTKHNTSFYHQKPYSKISYFWWEDPDGVIRQKCRFDY